MVEPVPAVFESAIAETSTGDIFAATVCLSFDRDIVGLSASDIVAENSSGIQVGDLTRISSGLYTVSLKGITESTDGDSLSIGVSKLGNDISPASLPIEGTLTPCTLVGHVWAGQNTSGTPTMIVFDSDLSAHIETWTLGTTVFKVSAGGANIGPGTLMMTLSKESGGEVISDTDIWALTNLASPDTLAQGDDHADYGDQQGVNSTLSSQITFGGLRDDPPLATFTLGVGGNQLTISSNTGVANMILGGTYSNAALPGTPLIIESMVADGSNDAEHLAATTKATITFNRDVDLTEDDVTCVIIPEAAQAQGGTGGTLGELTGSGKVWEVAISGVAHDGIVYVGVRPAGYAVIPNDDVFFSESLKTALGLPSPPPVNKRIMVFNGTHE